MKTSKSRASRMKGFFFTLATLIVLGYILASLTLWTKSMAIAEREYSEKFRMSNMELVLDQISQDKVEKFSNIAAYSAIHSLNEISKSYPLKEGDGCDKLAEDHAFRESCYYYVKDAFWAAFSNSSVNPDDFQGVISRETELANKGVSFADWFSNMNSTISESGLQVESYSLGGFKLEQDGMNSFNYSFKITFSIGDNSGMAHVTRDYDVHGNFLIDGLVDPAIYRITYSATIPVEKQFFFHLSSRNLGGYDTPSDLLPNSIGSGAEGQGWFYGQVVSVGEAASSPLLSRNSTILMGSYQDILGLISQPGSLTSPDWKQFGAYIVTSAPENLGPCGSGVNAQNNIFNAIGCDSDGDAEIKGEFMEKPYIVIIGLGISDIPSYNYQGTVYPGESNSKRMVLFTNKHSPEDVRRSPADKLNSEGALYDMEKLRDSAICGYYVHNPAAPSYFQRLFADSYSFSDEKFGIESFAFGKWVGGTDADGQSVAGSYSDELSRLDRELFASPPIISASVLKVKGMPGCKTFSMCTAESPIGHFHLVKDESASDYLGDFEAKVLCADFSCAGGWSE